MVDAPPQSFPNRAGVRALAALGLIGALLACAGCGDDSSGETFSSVEPGGMRDGGPRAPVPGMRRDSGMHDTEIFSGDLYLCG